MKNYSQYKNSEVIPKSIFGRFGIFLFIFSWIFPIAQIMFYMYMNPNPLSDDMGNKLNNSFSLFAQIPYIILLLLLVLNTRKIKSNIQHNRNIRLFRLFYIGLFLCLIRYFSFLLDNLYFIFSKNNDWNVFTIIILILNLPGIGVFVEVITWYSLRSFFRNQKDLISMKIRRNEKNNWRNEYNSATILTFAAVWQILSIFLPYILYSGASFAGASEAANQFIRIFDYIFIILYTIGFFMLSISLMKGKISTKGDHYYNNARNGNLEDKINTIAEQKKSCGYCGHNIEEFMNFCPECGNSLSS